MIKTLRSLQMHNQSFLLRLICITLLFTTLNSCSKFDNGENELSENDFDKILENKQLRVLIPRTKGNIYLPRNGYPLDTELEQIEAFAENHKLELEKIYIPEFDQLITKLIDGHGDIIAANMTVTEERKGFIDFSLPIHHVRQQLLQRVNDKPVKKRSDLKGMKIAVKPSTSFWPTLQKLKDKYPSIKIIALKEDLDIDEILDRIVNKEFDATIQDTNLIDSLKSYRFDISGTLLLSKEQPIAWGLRQNNPLLKEALNKYVQQQELSQTDNEAHTSDWKQIKRRKVIRMITRNNAANYFLFKGQLLGFEYELAQQFAKKNKLRLEIIVPPEDEDLFDWLSQGKGDFIAASLSPTNKRLAKEIKFSRHYLKTQHQLVQRKDEELIIDLEQLNGRTIAIRKSSAYTETIKNLQDIGIKVTPEFVPEDLETEEIINRVAIGLYDLTVSDSHLLELEMLWRDDIQASMSLSNEKEIGWVVRNNNPSLLKAINRFHRKNYKSLVYNLTYQKYFVNASHKTKEIADKKEASESISPYDDIVKEYATKYGFDWKLITAQMYQESRFDPNAKSWVGALGLLQVMPRTGKEFGFTNLKDPQTGLHAGVKYLQWVQNRFDEELPVKDRMWFTLASYNAGVGHVRDARRLAKKMGWNPNRWFNNVERAMLLLRLKKYHRRSRFGFVRGREPVAYVRKIKHHYEAYSKLIPDQIATLN